MHGWEVLFAGLVVSSAVGALEFCQQKAAICQEAFGPVTQHGWGHRLISLPATSVSRSHSNRHQSTYKYGINKQSSSWWCSKVQTSFTVYSRKS
ncbi:hypothetical protein Hamer_G015879 [Homarus americanus]|uniref:Secreted protein n=1 Tax=Homarus americanus TaxID=6706 RepID=A0A8J5MML5_HOMAM|nr:hypothetical protein Hamer_G015879 [Homarus americanus]